MQKGRIVVLGPALVVFLPSWRQYEIYTVAAYWMHVVITPKDQLALNF
jgi:hypothetical protein